MGSRGGAPNSASAYCWYKLPITAVHLRVRPLFWLLMVWLLPLLLSPPKCELCRCNRRLTKVAKSPSLVSIVTGSPGYIWKKKNHIFVNKNETALWIHSFCCSLWEEIKSFTNMLQISAITWKIYVHSHLACR